MESKCSASPVVVRTLLCHRDVDLALRCLPTWTSCSVDPIAIAIHEDGSLTAEDDSRLQDALPGCRFVRRQEADAVMAERLARHSQARAFRANSVWGLKLLDIVLAEAGDCFYMDCDIRFFRPFNGLFCGNAVAGRSIFLRDTVWMAYSVRPWHLLDGRRLRIAQGINTGLTIIESALYDLDFVDWFLAQRDWRVIPAWTEPTCWAALALRANGHAVDPAQVMNLYPSARVTASTIGAHFVSAYRNRFSVELNSPAVATGQETPIRFIPLRESGPIALGLSQLKRKIGNEIARRRR